MGQNDSEAQSNTLMAFLQEFSAHPDHDEVFPELRTNATKEGGTFFIIFVCKRSCGEYKFVPN